MNKRNFMIEARKERGMTQDDVIHSALVSAQNRQRFYVTNFGDIEQLEDRGILLNDILGSGKPLKEKSHCIDVCYCKGGNYSDLKKQSGQRLMVAEAVCVGTRQTDKSRTITAMYHKKGQRDFKQDSYSCGSSQKKQSELF